jgi:hypothetical protein
MPTATYIALANTTLSSNTSTVTFSSIPATYRDLVVVINLVGLTGTPTTAGGYVSLNGGSTASVWMYGTGSGSGSGGTSPDITMPFENGHGSFIVNVMDYSATDKHKAVLIRGNTASVSTWAIVGRWGSTDAVTSVALNAPDSGADQFVSGSTFALYGIVS